MCHFIRTCPPAKFRSRRRPNRYELAEVTLEHKSPQKAHRLHRRLQEEGVQTQFTPERGRSRFESTDTSPGSVSESPGLSPPRRESSAATLAGDRGYRSERARSATSYDGGNPGPARLDHEELDPPGYDEVAAAVADAVAPAESGEDGVGDARDATAGAADPSVFRAPLEQVPGSAQPAGGDAAAESNTDPIDTTDYSSLYFNSSSKKELYNFVSMPAAEMLIVRCQITRKTSGMGRSAVYYCKQERPNPEDGSIDLVHILAAKQGATSKGSNYVISIDPTDISKFADNYVAKLRSNIKGTEFTVFDDGANPKKVRLLFDKYPSSGFGVTSFVALV